MRVLVAEDLLVIGIDIAERLVEAGHSVIGPFARRSEIMEWISHDRPDAAVLDLQLLDGSCEDAVRELSRRGVPVVAFTGDEDCLPEDLTRVVTIMKPAAVEQIIAALAKAKCG